MIVIGGGAVATVDASGTEHRAAMWSSTVTGLWRWVRAPPTATRNRSRTSTRPAAWSRPAWSNTHHHLYQWATRGLAQQQNLFGWLTELYPIWSGIDEEVVGAAAAAGLGWLALSGCTTSTDHHYVFPRGRGDLFAATIDAATAVGMRFHPARGSMDLGVSAGGLPPDDLVEKTDEALAATQEAIDRFHDPSPGAMLRIAIAPCSPFSVTPDLMRESAALARGAGVRLHTHLAETLEESSYCQREHGCTPVEYAEQLGFLGDECGSRTAFTAPRWRLLASARPAPEWRTARVPTPGWAPASRRCGTCSTRTRRSASASKEPRRRRPDSSAPSCARRCTRRGCGAGRRP